MAKKYPIHSDFKKFNIIRLPMKKPVLNAAKRFMPIMWKLTPVSRRVSEIKIFIPRADGGKIPATVFIPLNRCGNMPCLIDFHGGAFALKGAPYHKKLAALYSEKCGCITVVPDYRLSVEEAYPAGLDDCFCSYVYMLKNAIAFGGDPSKIAVCGDSAGAALAVGVSLRAAEEGLPVPVFQCLIYPVADSECATASMDKYPDTPMWNARLNREMWKLYLGENKTDGIASPFAAENISALPPTYIETAEFDCLHDEGIALAEKLRQSGVPVTLRETFGTVHGYDMAMSSQITKASVAARTEALKKAFY